MNEKEQLQHFIDEKVHDKEEEDKKKREKIEAKKKNKESLMKMNQ